MRESPSHTVGLEQDEFLREVIAVQWSPSHPVGSELETKLTKLQDRHRLHPTRWARNMLIPQRTSSYTEGVSIPPSGLRTRF